MHFVYFITMLLYVWFAPLNSCEKGNLFFVNCCLLIQNIFVPLQLF
ncbi:unknown [Prevotella sp. CAG:1092]|nr:unknown [Prevotella sp. CAG:1092]